jgi:hypothetical protein
MVGPCQFCPPMEFLPKFFAAGFASGPAIGVPKKNQVGHLWPPGLFLETLGLPSPNLMAGLIFFCGLFYLL